MMGVKMCFASGHLQTSMACFSFWLCLFGRGVFAMIDGPLPSNGSFFKDGLDALKSETVPVDRNFALDFFRTLKLLILHAIC
jgi:hypothetical protein